MGVSGLGGGQNGSLLLIFSYQYFLEYLLHATAWLGVTGYLGCHGRSPYLPGTLNQLTLVSLPFPIGFPAIPPARLGWGWDGIEEDFMVLEISSLTAAL